VHGYDAARALTDAIRAGATDRESLANALRMTSFTGPRGATSIDPATNNIVQPIFVYETVTGENGAMTQKVLATLPAEADPVNGCVMPAPATN
jgi:branched-chain amino acid transport system substrate-binding protein